MRRKYVIDGLFENHTKCYNIFVQLCINELGVAQLVARYLGVVEAARSSRVTQTIKIRNKSRLLRIFI